MAEPVTAKWLDAVTRSHTQLVKLETLNRSTLQVNQQVVGVAGGARSPITAGSVTAKQNAEGTRTCSFTLADIRGLWFPRQTSDAFWINNAVRLSMGIAYGDGTTEYASLGTFRVQKFGGDRSVSGRTLDVEGIDFWKVLTYTKLTSVAKYAAGSTLLAAFNDLLTRAGLTSPTDIDASANATTFHAAPSADLQFARGTSLSDCFSVLASDYGWDFWFSATGTFIARPHLLYSQRASSGTIVRPGPLWTRSRAGLDDSADVANHVGVASTNPDIQPIFSEAKDNDTTSPTWVGGALGDRYYEYGADWIQTQAQADSEAASLLSRKIGYSKWWEGEGVPQPWLCEGDVMTLTDPEWGIAARSYYVESFTLPLDGHAMTAKLLEVRSMM